jgi:hypothetical protein
MVDYLVARYGTRVILTPAAERLLDEKDPVSTGFMERG